MSQELSIDACTEKVTLLMSRRKKGAAAVDELFEALENYFEQPAALSKSEFARAAGISRNHLYELLARNNDPSMRLAERIGELIGVRIRFEKVREPVCQN